MIKYYSLFMGSKTLSKSEIKNINEQILDLYGREFFDKKDFVQLFDKPVKHLKSNKDPIFFYFDDKPVPFLKFLYKTSFLKKVVVDMGAVKFVCGGADVMRPGIVEIDESIGVDEFVVVVDEVNKKPLVVGQALFSGVDMKEKTEGKVIKNLHFVSDELWSL